MVVEPDVVYVAKAVHPPADKEEEAVAQELTAAVG